MSVAINSINIKAVAIACAVIALIPPVIDIARFNLDPQYERAILDDILGKYP